ncbi:hypothetical protein CPB84DRAFT_1847015 [Gymnopilus junonius]|uniref:CRIB domain-containing protein n=1 Tax=Gymnopilus junonius TaxID=109634 RepID=A0A9P5NQ59_GYMJU|nr:hypothetical protein CPB84DRAFT_1847015 [Gymnopilus junonius]
MTSTDSSSSSRFNPFRFKEKPPPLPPKDPVYQQRSPPPTATDDPRVSLLDSPLSPSIQYAIRRANSPSPSPLFAAESIRSMSRSSPELLPVKSIEPSIADTTRQTTASKKDKALAFLKFPKRSPRSPPSTATGTSSSASSVIVIGSASAEEPDPPPPQEDDGISLPWNFQHNIHVDEGYVGLPPSWSTSLASAGFTEEEIAAIQTRRTTGVRSPPSLQYLYNERPRSPAVTSGFPFSTQSTSGVPILTHPTPRTTSLNPSRLGPSAGPSTPETLRPPTVPASSSAQQRPPTNVVYGSSSASSSTPSLSGSLKPNPYYSPASTSNPNRIPPPKRKPPMPMEELESPSVSRPGHRPNDPSISTIGCSTDSHGFGTSDSHARSHHNHSASQTTTTTVSVSTHPYGSSSQSQSKTNLDDDDDVPLAKARAPVRQGSESTFNGKASLAGGMSKFRVVNGSGSTMDLNGEPSAKDPLEQERKAGPSSWSSKILKATTGKNRESPSAPPSASNSVSGHSASHSISAPTSSSDHSHSSHAGPSTSLAASSPWSSVIKQSSNLVEAVKTSAGKGIGRIRSKNGINVGKKEKAGKKDKITAKNASSEDIIKIGNGNGRESGSEDEEGSEYEYDVEDAPHGEKRSIRMKSGPWQIYSRPRAATDALSGRLRLRAVPLRHSLPPTSITRRLQVQYRGGCPEKPPILARCTARAAMAHCVIETWPTPARGSIPEVSPPPLPEGSNRVIRRSMSLGRKDSGKKRAGAGRKEVVPQLPGQYAWSEPPSAVAGPSRSGSSPGAGPSVSDLPPSLPPISIPKRAPAHAPRLSLHRSKDSSDLASWSEALLSGISLSGDSLDLGFSFGLGKDDVGRGKEKERERDWFMDRGRVGGKGKEREVQAKDDFLELESPVTVTTATIGGGRTARPWEMSRSGQPASSPVTTRPPQQLPQPEPQPQAVPLVQQQNSPTTTTASSSSASSRAGTPPVQHRLTQMRKAGQPLPTSKPPPQRPIPPIKIANPNGVNSSPNPRMVIPPLPLPQSGLDSPVPMSGVAEPAMTARAPTTPLSAGANKPLPPLRPAPPLPDVAPHLSSQLRAGQTDCSARLSQTRVVVDGRYARCDVARWVVQWTGQRAAVERD